MREPSRLRERATPERQQTEIIFRWFAAVRGAIGRSTMLTTILAIALGAAVGANVRYGLSIWAAQLWAPPFRMARC